ncbi:hypothetical protein [Mariniluteicoccus flavus]
MNAREVFAGPFDAFVARRKDAVAAAREAGEKDAAKAIATWKKPTRGAWLVNLLSLHEPDQVAEALALGESLAEAHRNADATQLRELSRLRTQLVSTLAKRAVELGRDDGYIAPDSVRSEVAETLTAGLADPEVAAGIRAGTLSRTVRASGFGPVDLFAPMAEVIQLQPRREAAAARRAAAPRPAEGAGDPEGDDGPDPARLAELSAALKRAERAPGDVTRAATEAQTQAQEAEDRAAAAAQGADAARAAVEAARAALAEAERALADQEKAEAQKRAAADAAATRTAEAEAESERAGAELDAVRDELSRLLGLSSGRS